MNRLEEILESKRAEIERLRPRAAELHRRASQRKDFRSFRSALQRADGKVAVIAEVKKASPSAGVMAVSFAPLETARAYERAGADAVSVLTDAPFFQGSLEHLSDIRAQLELPLLRKDFVLDEVQIAESAANGADAILLIVAALEQKQLEDLFAAASDNQLDALVEVHTLPELERALSVEAGIIGINNRDLGTFAVDLSVTEKLSEEVPDEVVLVSESGIKSAGDVKRLEACGVNAILVGEALMRGQTTIEKLRP